MPKDPPDARVIAGPPLLQPDQPVPVTVLDEGTWWPGFVTARQGERVLAVYCKTPGSQEVHWLSTDRVRRTEGALQNLD
jgi:hypothetical protein